MVLEDHNMSDTESINSTDSKATVKKNNKIQKLRFL